MKEKKNKQKDRQPSTYTEMYKEKIIVNKVMIKKNKETKIT